MREYAVYPSAIQEAVGARNRGEPAAAVLRALLQRPDGQWDGLGLLLLARRGIEAGAADTAAALGTRPEELAAAVSAALPDGTSEPYPLTGAEAVALMARQCGGRVAFGYAGTSELALCDALVRLPGVRAVNGRGDTESAFMAAGASLFEPAAGVAVLHGARGLTNATGAVADARRNEIAVVVLVGLPSTGSAPFLPPHGEPDLLASVGASAKSWVELGAVPEEEAERRAVAAHLAAVVRDAFSAARTPPFGPVLVGIPQDVAEAAWVPPSVLDPVGDAGCAAPEAGRGAGPGRRLPAPGGRPPPPGPRRRLPAQARAGPAGARPLRRRGRRARPPGALPARRHAVRADRPPGGPHVPRLARPRGPVPPQAAGARRRPAHGGGPQPLPAGGRPAPRLPQACRDL